MTIKELAKELGRSHQAVYKKLGNAGIDLNALKNPTTGELTTEGEKIVRELYSPKATATEALRTEVESEVEKVESKVESEVERLQSELNALQLDLIEAKHKAEVAEIRATAAEDERDYLRSQLDNAIKASALASVKRIAAASTVDDEQDQRSSVMVEEADPAEGTAQQPAEKPVRKSDQAQPRSLRQRWRDAVMAWKGKA